MSGPDLLETTTPAAAGDTRRLTTKAKVKADLGETTTTYDTLIDQYIDQVSDMAARFANLAADTAGAFPTFGAETLRATWYAGAIAERCGNLLLPWRPKWAVSAVTEGGVSLVAGTDYRLNAGGELQRIRGGYPAEWWALYDVVVTFTAGWTLPTGVPAALEARVIDQAKLAFAGRDRDPGLRSLSIPDVSAEQFNVPGGSTVGASGLLVSLEAALASYQGPAL